MLAAPVSMNRFMHQVSADNRATGDLGPELTQPRAYYDWPTARFFVTEGAALVNTSGVPLGPTVQLVAVSQTSNPTGAWSIYSYEITNGDEAGCPCFPDVNQLGADRHGLYLSTSLVGVFTRRIVGVKIYALPKAALEAGAGGPTPVVAFPLLPNDFSVFPTIVPPHGRFATENKGSEYFVEGTADLARDGIGKQMKVFAVTNTTSLAAGAPNLTLQSITLASQAVDANMPPAIQKKGPRPLGGGGSGGLHEPAPLLEPGDGRVGSTPYYVNGTIWAVSGTAVAEPDGFVTDGVAWFEFQTSGQDGPLNASIADQGIISAPNHVFLTFPAIAMNASGTGAIGVTLSSWRDFPSAATIAMPEFASPTITVSGAGALPDDGYTAYPEFGGNGVGLWGAYGAAAVDGFGNVWFGNEYVPDTATHPRTPFANWGTYVTRLAP